VLTENAKTTWVPFLAIVHLPTQDPLVNIFMRVPVVHVYLDIAKTWKIFFGVIVKFFYYGTLCDHSCVYGFWNNSACVCTPPYQGSSCNEFILPPIDPYIGTYDYSSSGLTGLQATYIGSSCTAAALILIRLVVIRRRRQQPSIQKQPLLAQEQNNNNTNSTNKNKENNTEVLAPAQDAPPPYEDNQYRPHSFDTSNPHSLEVSSLT